MKHQAIFFSKDKSKKKLVSSAAKFYLVLYVGEDNSIISQKIQAPEGSTYTLIPIVLQ